MGRLKELYHAENLALQKSSPIVYVVPKHTRLAWMCKDICIALKRQTTIISANRKRDPRLHRDPRKEKLSKLREYWRYLYNMVIWKWPKSLQVYPTSKLSALASKSITLQLNIKQSRLPTKFITPKLHEGKSIEPTMSVD